MRSASSGGWPRPVRWSLWSTAGAASDLVVRSVAGWARLRPEAI